MAEETSLATRMAAWPAEIKNYFEELQLEMKRVTWPPWKQVRATTGVVIVAVFAFARLFLPWWTPLSAGDSESVRYVYQVEARRPMPDDMLPEENPMSEAGARTDVRALRRAGGRPRKRPPKTVRLLPSLSDKNWFIIHTYSGFEQKVAGLAAQPRRSLRIRRADRPDSDPHRRSGGTAQREKGHQQADALSGLRAGGNGNERRAVARREGDAARDRLRGRRQLRPCR